MLANSASEKVWSCTYKVNEIARYNHCMCKSSIETKIHNNLAQVKLYKSQLKLKKYPVIIESCKIFRRLRSLHEV